MRFRLWGALLLGAAAIAATVATSALAGNWSRDALRNVVTACAMAKSTVGLSFPCTDVRLGAPGSDGYALIRSPGFASEFLVTPLGPVDGIESPELQSDAATGLWNTAWSARADVAEALGRPLPRTGVGLAVNAVGTRTQDHFHIHVDCVRQSVGRALQARAKLITADWRKLPMRLAGDTYWVRALAGSDLAGTNVTRLVADSPPAADTPLDRATVAVIAAKLADGSDGFYLLANWTDSSAERLLDHACRGH
ncbi:MAG: CDP-diacylglycerol diphosphatase [Devosia sp.]|nr:CDP-diacylglycerol diphosphatase [Devosia sp.]